MTIDFTINGLKTWAIYTAGACFFVTAIAVVLYLCFLRDGEENTTKAGITTGCGTAFGVAGFVFLQLVFWARQT
jgi:hypothetical protein